MNEWRDQQSRIFVSQQQLAEQAHDKTFDRLTVGALGVFLILVAFWAVDQVLIQLQIWYHEAAAWASEAVQTVASFWPF